MKKEDTMSDEERFKKAIEQAGLYWHAGSKQKIEKRKDGTLACKFDTSLNVGLPINVSGSFSFYPDEGADFGATIVCDVGSETLVYDEHIGRWER
jgi:hypothetical protein